MPYHYTYKGFTKRKMGVTREIFFKTFKWIKPEDSENLTKNLKHDKPASLGRSKSTLTDTKNVTVKYA